MGDAFIRPRGDYVHALVLPPLRFQWAFARVGERYRTGHLFGPSPLELGIWTHHPQMEWPIVTVEVFAHISVIQPHTVRYHTPTWGGIRSTDFLPSCAILLPVLLACLLETSQLVSKALLATPAHDPT